MIEKLTKQDQSEFSWLSPEGMSYQDRKQYLQTGILKFCGCGDPDENLEYILKCLKEIEAKDPVSDNGPAGLFFCYWADKEGLTEHGGSIYSGCLSDKGKELLKDIEWCLENEKDEI